MDLNPELKAKYRSSPNIAWVKYWGKFDEDYILPINDSLGLTLNQEDINTETTIKFSSSIPQNSIILNNEPHKISKRMQKMFKMIKSKAYEKLYQDKIKPQDWDKYHFYVQSVNSFPTASGMASSASGLACLAVALNGLFQGLLTDVELSELARLGSGSASRSVYGGLVRWKGVPHGLFPSKQKPSKQTLEQLSKKCISFTSVGAQKLKSIKVLILLASNKQKQISSTSGMATSVETSQLIKYRNKIANTRIQQILSDLLALQQIETENIVDKTAHMKTFNKIAQNIVKDSNQFHAICLDTYPPIFYLNQFSKQIISIVDLILNPILHYKVAYTFDAGPHAFLFLHQSVELTVIQYFQSIFNLSQESFNKKAWKKLSEAKQNQWGSIVFKKYEGPIIKPFQVWSTEVGGGAYRID